jgi:protein involved in polysaccharide export with SLBB domain
MKSSCLFQSCLAALVICVLPAGYAGAADAPDAGNVTAPGSTATAITNNKTSTATANVQRPDSTRHLQPKDKFALKCMDGPSINNYYVVAPDGTIALPYLRSPIKVAGLTIDDAIKEITQMFMDKKIFLRDPQITIAMVDSASQHSNSSGPTQRIYVEGQVNHPGPIEVPLDQELTLKQAIMMAGGPTRDASILVTITRKNPDGTITTMKDVNMGPIVYGKAKDIPLQDGDSVFIGESWTGAVWA